APVARPPAPPRGGARGKTGDKSGPRSAPPPQNLVPGGAPPLLPLAPTTPAAPADPHTTTPPADRTGWGGDGGALHDFLNTAIIQHYPKRLARVQGTDFRLAIADELDAVDAFQPNLGPLTNPNRTLANMSDALAHNGRTT